MKKLVGAMLLLFALPAISSAHTFKESHFAGAFAHPRTFDANRIELSAAQPDPQTSSGHSVSLTCTPGTTDATHDPATSFNFKRSATTGGPYTQIGTASACAFSDTNVSAGQKWFYVATAVNTAGESAQSNEVSATISTFPPAPPTSLVGVPK